MGSLRGRSRILRQPISIASFAVILVILLSSLFAGFLAPYNPAAQSADVLLAPGSPGHLLGTDNLGRDQLSRLLYGSRPLLIVSAFSVAIAVIIGLIVGLVAAYARGVAETVLMRTMDVLLSFPLVLLGIMIVAALGAGQRNLILAVTFALIPIVARLVHSLTLREASREYVTAARAVGMTPRRIMFREIVPNLIGPVVVQATSLFALAAGFASALSYLGLGIAPPASDWGLMVKEGQPFVGVALDLAVVPGVCITLLLTAVTFIGDDLRDFLDPDRRLEAGFGG